MRSSTAPDLRGLCPRCYLAIAACLCADVVRTKARTRISILRHHKESWRTSNTGRLAVLALEHASIVDYGAPGGASLERIAIDGDAWLLFPGGETLDMIQRPGTLIVLDGSWRQARRALHRHPRLLALPRLSIAAPRFSVRPRRARSPFEMSTLEAVACAIAELEGEAVAAPLFDLFQRRIGLTPPSRTATPARR